MNQSDKKKIVKKSAPSATISKTTTQVVSPVVKPPVKPPVKLSMSSMRIVAKWHYTCENQECLLCHKNLMFPIQEPDTNKLNSDVIIGTCQHGFHALCINKWTSQKNTECPVCKTEWDVIKNVGSSVYVYKAT